MKKLLLSLMFGAALCGTSFAEGTSGATGTGTSGNRGTGTGTGTTGSGTKTKGTTTPQKGIDTTNPTPKVPASSSDRLDPTGRGVPATGAPMTSSPITGTVESIDRSGNRVRIRNEQGLVTEYNINNDTSFTNRGKTGKFTDVKTGDSVTMENNPDAGVSKVDFGRPVK